MGKQRSYWMQDCVSLAEKIKSDPHHEDFLRAKVIRDLGTKIKSLEFCYQHLNKAKRHAEKIKFRGR